MIKQEDCQELYKLLADKSSDMSYEETGAAVVEYCMSCKNFANCSKPVKDTYFRSDETLAERSTSLSRKKVSLTTRIFRILKTN